MNCAVFSPCGRYRYQLWRTRLQQGDLTRPTPQYVNATVVFVMLNPSTADHRKDDPTIRRCMGFAEQWGYDRLGVVNLYGWRATDPRHLLLEPDRVARGPENMHYVLDALGHAQLAIAAWGTRGHGTAAAADLLARYTPPLVRGGWQCLGLTKGGAPRHPLYVPYTAPLVALTT